MDSYFSFVFSSGLSSMRCRRGYAWRQAEPHRGIWKMKKQRFRPLSPSWKGTWQAYFSYSGHARGRRFRAVAFFVDFCKRTVDSALDSYRASNSAQNAALDASVAAHIAENQFPYVSLKVSLAKTMSPVDVIAFFTYLELFLFKYITVK